MVKTTLKTLPYFDNVGTILVTFLLEPVFQILFLTLLSGGNFSTNSVTGMIMLGAASMTVVTVSSLFVTDQDLGIDVIALKESSGQIKYWITKIIVGILMSLLSNLPILLVFQLFFSKFSVVTYGQLIIVMLVSGIVGFTSAVVSWTRNNPYFLTNLVLGSLTVLSGALISINHYPFWLKSLTYLLPYNQVFNQIVFGQSVLWIAILQILLWLIIGLVFYQYRKSRL
ncbi:MAG: hypothetical protein LBM27_05120 [Lactobacillaceae bacterium]|jgi:ABC-2 type transport system permease protein|nr:hypothetical protein [Lactobacillaceae bacterium]